MDTSWPPGVSNEVLGRHADDLARPYALSATIEPAEAFLAFCTLEDRSPAEVLDGFGTLVRATGVSLARSMVAWRTLDTRFATKQLVWKPNAGLEVENFNRQKAMQSEVFLASPLKALLDQRDSDVIRRRICDPAEQDGFPALAEFAADGMTDYAIWKIGFGLGDLDAAPGAGIIISFASDRPGGFTEDEFAALSRLRYMMAVAVRNSIQNEMRENVTRTYLARSAGDLVRVGDMLNGSGSTTDSVIWYSDLRGSTALCERLGLDAYLELLNDYFAATAGEVAAHDGDILDFIGDAVLAAWPRSEEGLIQALAATRAACAALEAFRVRRANQLGGAANLANVAGIAVDTGVVMSGNIGITERLTFSVIGSTVNQVARIERMTKVLHQPVLVTAEVAAAEPGVWTSCGQHALAGVAEPVELFSLAHLADAARAWV